MGAPAVTTSNIVTGNGLLQAGLPVDLALTNGLHGVRLIQGTHGLGVTHGLSGVSASASASTQNLISTHY